MGTILFVEGYGLGLLPISMACPEIRILLTCALIPATAETVLRPSANKFVGFTF